MFKFLGHFFVLSLSLSLFLFNSAIHLLLMCALRNEIVSQQQALHKQIDLYATSLIELVEKSIGGTDIHSVVVKGLQDELGKTRLALRDIEEKMEYEKQKWIGLDAERNEADRRWKEKLIDYASLELKLQNAVHEKENSLRSAILETQNSTRQEQSERLITLASKVEREIAIKDMLQLEIGRLKDQLAQSKRECDNWQQKYSTPGLQGMAGENETEERLRTAFGHFLTVQNVSKIGQGKQMDLRLTTRDESILIAIDCKNYVGHGGLPEKEVLRFNQDMDHMMMNIVPPPQAYILFSKPPTKDANALYNKQKRGQGWRYHVGMWCFHGLIDVIHDAILTILLERQALKKHDEKSDLQQPDPQQTVSSKEMIGKKEVQSAVNEMVTLIHEQQQGLTTVYDSVKRVHTHATARNRCVLDALQNAHSAQPDAVTQALVKEYESKLPKQARGRPPTIRKSTQLNDVPSQKHKKQKRATVEKKA